MAAVEYDPVHAATHLFNFPDCEILCRDASRLTGVDLLDAARVGFSRLYPAMDFPGEVDALIGGPPCQGFSTGGKREQDDVRNSLLIEFVRLVEEVRPRTFCLENVAGLLESKFDVIRSEAFDRLIAAGYSLSGTDAPVNSLDFGVPQKRRRMIVLGALGDSCPARPTSLSEVVSVADAFEGLPRIEDYECLYGSDVARLSEDDLSRLRDVPGRYARELIGLDVAEGIFSRPRVWDWTTTSGGRRTRHQQATVDRFSETEPGSVEPKSRLYRLPKDGPARTLRAGTGAERGAHTSPRPIHPSEDRVITVREAARLHGYPDWFRFHTTNWHGHRQVGNSVPPPLARAAGRALVKFLGYSPLVESMPIKLGDEGLLKLSQSKALPVVNGVDSELPSKRRRPVSVDK